MRFDDMYAAFSEAEQSLRNLDGFAEKLAKMLVGRIRKVDNDWVLQQLKRELQNYDARAKRWKR